MKTRIQVALFSVLASILAHLYLTTHYYALKFGYASDQSICNLNAKFNCDAVAASDYASLFGIPLSLWGFATNLILFGLILMGWLEWTNRPDRLRRFAFALSTLSVIGSLVMGSISVLYLRSYCLVCLGLYVLSLIVWLAYFAEPGRSALKNLKTDLTRHFAESLPVAASFLAVPILAYVTHLMFLANASERGAGNMDQIAENALVSWAAAPKRDFVAKPSLVMGPTADKAALTLVEFADFRCTHCKHASLTLDAFVRAHPDVRFEFYAFPLDGACNADIKQANHISCRLAEAVYCAEKDGGRGWDMHHALYAAQDEVNSLGDLAGLDVILSKSTGELGLNWPTLQHCLEDAATVDAMRAQAKQGSLVSVQGTPTIFANARQLEGGQLMPVLEAAYRQTLKDRSGK